MSSTVASSPTARFSGSDSDMDVDIDRASTAVPSSPSANSYEELKPHVGMANVVKEHGEDDRDAFEESPDASKAGAKDKSDEQDLPARLQRLDALLEKSIVYSNILGERMNKARQGHRATEAASAASVAPAPKAQGKKGRGRKSVPAGASKAKAGSKRGRQSLDDEDDADATTAKRLKLDDGLASTLDDSTVVRQPEAITGAKLKDYQLVGVAWLASLWENGVNGILADEMGLGKTLQTIAFLAYVRQRGASKPALIVCPLSVLHNWMDEFQKFAPSIPVCMYHGTPAERAEIRNTRMRKIDEEPSSPKKGTLPTEQSKERPATDAEAPRAPKKKAVDKGDKKKRSQKRKAVVVKEKPTRTSSRGSSHAQSQLSFRRSSRHHQEEDTTRVEDGDGESEADDSSAAADAREGADGGAEDEGDELDVESPLPKDEVDVVEQEELPRQTAVTFPIVLTTFEMIIKDRQHLAKYDWNFIVVDEGHRLKNMDCKLMQEIKKYNSANRLILTGTPLHNNLAELWSLLNFILPDIFQDLDSFQEWFNLPSLQSTLPNDQSTHVISKLHGILKPFLLRRLKADVEHSLPPKKEYVLYAPLSERQRGVYDAVLSGALRGYLINGRQDDKAKEESKPPDKGRQMRKRRKVSYSVDGDDDEWFKKLQEGEFAPQAGPQEEIDAGRQFHYKNTVKQVNSMKLQNTVMQLRKVCSHPFLFDWPSDPVTREPVVNEQLVNASGKMMVLDRLLGELFTRGHKVLLFSQFTTMLDIIEEWAYSFKSWSTCRIDGSTGPLERRAEMNRFQQGGDDPDAPRLFLLSTRAGGLGINLTAADTVIFYDQDWNPQMDIQAQDRAHRIGQTKPVLIFRLVSAHTVETKIMQKANEKRKLEALVIAKGKFRMPGSTSRNKGETVTEMAASLLKLEGEKIEVVPSSEASKAKVISDSDLNKLLDRSPEVFADRGKGWTSGAKATREDGEKKAKGDVAFEVFEAPVDQCNDGLAAMMGEKLE